MSLLLAALLCSVSLHAQTIHRAPTGGGSGTPGGSSGQVQFNSSGTFAGDSGFTYDAGTDTATVGAVTVPGTASFGMYYSPMVDDGNSGTADTIDFSQGNEHLSTLTGNVTYTFSNPQSGGRYVLILKQDATGSRTVTWPASVAWPGATAPVLTTTAGKIDICTFIYLSSTAKYYGTCNYNF